MEALKALVFAQQSALDSRATQIENLKLPILKPKRMHFGPRSEKFNHDIEQLELRLEDLEANRAAAEPLPPKYLDSTGTKSNSRFLGNALGMIAAQRNWG